MLHIACVNIFVIKLMAFINLELREHSYTHLSESQCQVKTINFIDISQILFRQSMILIKILIFVAINCFFSKLKNEFRSESILVIEEEFSCNFAMRKQKWKKTSPSERILQKKECHYWHKSIEMAGILGTASSFLPFMFC